MFVHHVDHPVSKTPEGEEKDEEDEGEEHIPPVIGDEHLFLASGARIEQDGMMFGSRSVHDNVSFQYRTTAVSLYFVVRTVGGRLNQSNPAGPA
jgi:hypothetical protein